jgi:hypothetical protein
VCGVGPWIWGNMFSTPCRLPAPAREPSREETTCEGLTEAARETDLQEAVALSTSLVVVMHPDRILGVSASQALQTGAPG